MIVYDIFSGTHVLKAYYIPSDDNEEDIAQVFQKQNSKQEANIINSCMNQDCRTVCKSSNTFCLKFPADIKQ